MEMFDVYDNDRNLTGAIYEKGHKLKESECRLVVHVCIFNSKGEMLIQQRQAYRRNWAGKWDISVGGCAQAGETSKDAIRREVKEEIGLDIDFSKERAFATINFENGFDDYYIIEKDFEISELTFQDEEVQNAKWATKEEIMKLRAEEKFVKYFPAFLEFLFDLKEKRSAFMD